MTNLRQHETTPPETIIATLEEEKRLLIAECKASRKCDQEYYPSNENEDRLTACRAAVNLAHLLD